VGSNLDIAALWRESNTHFGPTAIIGTLRGHPLNQVASMYDYGAAIGFGDITILPA